MGNLVTLTSLSQIKYLLLVLSYEAEGTQEMSNISGVINDTENIYGLFLRLKIFPTKPLSPQIYTVMSEDINRNFATKTGITASWKLEEFCWKRSVTVQGRYRGAASMQHFVLVSK